MIRQIVIQADNTLEIYGLVGAIDGSIGLQVNDRLVGWSVIAAPDTIVV